MDLGKVLTQCLQRVSASTNGSRCYAATGPSVGRGSLYTNICHQSGGCDDPDDFKIEVYHNVYCRVVRSAYPWGTWAGTWDQERFGLYNTVLYDDANRYQNRGRRNLGRSFGY